MLTGNEWSLNNTQRASISSLVFLGQILGGTVLGPISDRFGRKKAFLISCFLIVTFGLLSGFVQTFDQLLVTRLVVGFGLGGVTVPFDLLAEFIPAVDRAKYLLYIEYFWTIGSVFVASIAWIALDKIGWRMLVIIVAAPVTLCAMVSIFYLPESPRWLLVKGRVKEAETIVSNAALAGGVKLVAVDPGIRLRLDGYSDSMNKIGDSTRTDNTNSITTLQSPTKSVNIDSDNILALAEKSTLVELLGTPALRRTSLLLWIIWTSFGFTYYGLILLVTKINSDQVENISSTSINGTLCQFDYLDIFLSASVEFFGVLLTVLLIDRWGRVKTQSSMYLLQGVSFLFLSFLLPFPQAVTLVAMVARLAAMGSSSATWVRIMLCISRVWNVI